MPTVCTGPIAYKGQAIIQTDLDPQGRASRPNVDEAFVPAIAPGMVGRGQNRYYATEEEYRFAIADALKTEYKAIVDAGFILQIDDPGLGETWDMTDPTPPLRTTAPQAMNLEALNTPWTACRRTVSATTSAGGAGRARTWTTSACGTSSTSC